MEIPKDYHFTREHEWVHLDQDNVATVGISEFAQHSLGDITYVQLPKPGAKVQKDDPFGVVESVKAVSDLYAPVSGRVLEINDTVIDNPALVNDSPYQDGWLIKVDIQDAGDMDDLMDAPAYQDYIEDK